MIRSLRSGFVGVLLFAATTLVSTTRAWGCSVCFGDPDSDMTKGAAAGVLVLVAIVGAVLLGIAGTGVYWIQRSRSVLRSDAHDSGGLP